MRVLFYLLTVLMWFSNYSYQSNFTPYLSFIGAGSVFTGLVIGSYGFVQFALRMPLGLWADRYKLHKKIIVAGISLAIVSSVIFLLTDNLILTLIARTLAGMTASVWVNVSVLFSNSFKKGESVKAVGLISFFNYTGQILGMQTGAILVNAAGYKSAFVAALAAACLALIPAMLIKNTGGEIKPPEFKELKAIIFDKRLISVSVIAIVSQFLTFGTTFGFLTRYADVVLNTTPAQNGILTVVPYIPNAIGALVLAQLLVGKVKEYKLIFTGLLLMSVFTFITPFIKDFTLLVIMQTFVGIGRGISFPLLMGLAIKHVMPEYRGTSMGVFQSVYAVGMFAGPFFSGIISETLSLGAVFFVSGAMCFAMSFIAHRVIKKTQSV